MSKPQRQYRDPLGGMAEMMAEMERQRIVLPAGPVNVEVFRRSGDLMIDGGEDRILTVRSADDARALGEALIKAAGILEGKA